MKFAGIIRSSGGSFDRRKLPPQSSSPASPPPLLKGSEIMKAIAVLVTLLLATPAAAQVRLSASGDYLGVGQTHYSGTSIGAGWRGVELAYRHVEGQGIVANGIGTDLYARWHNLFATGGVSYLNVAGVKGHGTEFDARVGGGVQFGWARAALRWEQFNRADGLTMSVGLSIPVTR
jgi:hypothetical protein